MQAKLDKLKQEQLTPEQRLIKEIVADPKATHAYVQLADIYRHHGDLDKAEKVLAKGLKANPDDHGLMQIYEDTQIGRLRGPSSIRSTGCRSGPRRPPPRSSSTSWSKMLDKYEIQAFRRRAKLHPEDARLHYELGQHPGPHRRPRRGDRRVPAGRPLEHRAHRQDPGPAPDGAELRGQRARRSWPNATTRRPSRPSSPRTRTTSTPSTIASAAIAETLGNTEAAEEHYNEVAANDYTYLDVAERLRRLI